LSARVRAPPSGAGREEATAAARGEAKGEAANQTVKEDVRF
jgi:hypothetical protein